MCARLSFAFVAHFKTLEMGTCDVDPPLHLPAVHPRTQKVTPPPTPTSPFPAPVLLGTPLAA